MDSSTDSDDHKLIQLAILQYKLAFGLRENSIIENEMPRLSFPNTWSYGKRIIKHHELAVPTAEIEKGLALLLHTTLFSIAVQLDAAFNSVDRFSIKDDETRNIALAARLIRSAFAHNPFSPNWEIGPKYLELRTIDVKDVLTLDLENIKGKPLQHSHFGGPPAVLRLAELGLVKLKKGIDT